MKRIFVSILLLLSVKVFAGTVEGDSLGKAYYDYSIWDNVYVGVNAGTSAIVNGDNVSKLGKNLSPIININAGVLFSPYFGGRVQVGYAKQKMWANNYNTTFANRPGLYQLKMDLVTAELDLTFDLLNLITGYSPERTRVFTLYPFAGAGWAHSMANNTNSDDLFFTAGLIGQFRLNKKWNINIEYADKFMPAAIEGWYNGHPCHNLMSLTVGVAYKINDYGFRILYAPKADYTSYENAMNDLNNRIKELQKELDAKNAEIIRLMKEKGVTAIPDMSVFFHLNSSKITKEGELILRQYAEAMKDTPENVVFEVYGYCDLATGSRPYNEKLKMRRANAVADLLVNKFGIPSSKISVKEGNLDNPPYPAEAKQYSRVVILEVKK